MLGSVLSRCYLWGLLLVSGVGGSLGCLFALVVCGVSVVEV